MAASSRCRPHPKHGLRPRALDSRIEDLGPSLVKVLAQAPHGAVELVYHPGLRVADYPDRKALARALEDAVRTPLARVVEETA